MKCQDLAWDQHQRVHPDNKPIDINKMYGNVQTLKY